MDKKKRIMKIKSGKIVKKFNFPQDYYSFYKKVQEILPIDESSKKYQFIEENSKMEIANKEDYELMSEKHKKEELIKVIINILNIHEDKENISLNNNKQGISNVAQINITNHINKEGNSIQDIESIVHEKMQQLEDKLVEQLYASIQDEMLKDNKINCDIDNNIDKKYIHKGIICNKCGEQNINGIRYKCVQCPDFNLCGKCEENSNHDYRHILIKVTYPVKSESEFRSKIDMNICYQNQDMNYEIQPKIFYIDQSDTEVLNLTLKNTGKIPWKKASLKFVGNSELKGYDFDINYNVISESSVNLNILINPKDQIKSNKKIYYSFLQMFNQRNEAFGNITKIMINIKD